MHRINPTTLERIETHDGTATLRCRGTELSYRSMWGARTESNVVFVAGTRLIERGKRWRIVELGFGAATNFCAVVQHARDRSASVEYWAVERDPVPPELVCAEGIAGEMAREAMELAQNNPSGRICVERESFVLNLVLGDWVGAPLPGDADAVFFDPFAPSVDPDSWSVDAFELAASCLSEDGVLATYSAASSVRKAMSDAGLEIASLDGPGREREVTVAGLRRDVVAHGRSLGRAATMG